MEGTEGTQGPEFGSFALNPRDWVGVGVGGQWGQEQEGAVAGPRPRFWRLKQVWDSGVSQMGV